MMIVEAMQAVGTLQFHQLPRARRKSCMIAVVRSNYLNLIYMNPLVLLSRSHLLRWCKSTHGKYRRSQRNLHASIGHHTCPVPRLLSHPIRLTVVCRPLHKIRIHPSQLLASTVCLEQHVGIGIITSSRRNVMLRSIGMSKIHPLMPMSRNDHLDGLAMLSKQRM